MKTEREQPRRNPRECWLFLAAAIQPVGEPFNGADSLRSLSVVFVVFTRL